MKPRGLLKYAANWPLIPIQGPHWLASNNANSFLQVRNAFWVSWGAGRRRGTKSIRARVCARENPMKPFVRTSFLGTRPSFLPSPGRPFFSTDDRKFITGPHRQPSKKILAKHVFWRLINALLLWLVALTATFTAVALYCYLEWCKATPKSEFCENLMNHESDPG